MKKIVSIALFALMGALLFAGGANDDTILIEVVSKGEQHQFWQQVRKGVEQAAEDLGVDVNYVGPASESEIEAQVNMVNTAIAKQPNALCLAALSTESVTEQLIQLGKDGIPVIGFDSGIANPPPGVVKSTASTNNYAAGALAATEALKVVDVKAGSRIVVVSQDAASVSVGERSAGFIDTMYDALTAKGLSVSIEGMTQGKGTPAVAQKYNYPSKVDGADVVIDFRVPANTSDIALVQGEAAAALRMDGVVAAYGSNEWGIRGIIEAANADAGIMSKLKSKEIFGIGFDSGTALLGAMRDGIIHGAITQDPYQIGYKAVDLAYKAINGETIPTVVDTGSAWYTTDNWGDPAINGNLYDWPDGINLGLQ